ncbi:hypothetical protein BGW36DRAFT_120493 [Talaromyces proteolyticus]|uniref:Uncharacterized protein n=1 Tax=Talaromyces proteolyticus TaxID=1131652 RepID=A0AAD4KYH0_9EURO|nr:uncharacterized protein BGW36DRAFT_120493 [Talaromyces proteolyticus]KAH8702601.1 hypothetical protein BGW36DRAFT_120493 [Talaromyces proteolyticus]
MWGVDGETGTGILNLPTHEYEARSYKVAQTLPATCAIHFMFRHLQQNCGGNPRTTDRQFQAAAYSCNYNGTRGTRAESERPNHAVGNGSLDLVAERRLCSSTRPSSDRPAMPTNATIICKLESGASDLTAWSEWGDWELALWEEFFSCSTYDNDTSVKAGNSLGEHSGIFNIIEKQHDQPEYTLNKKQFIIRHAAVSRNSIPCMYALIVSIICIAC